MDGVGAAPRIGTPVALFPDRFILTSGRDMDLSRDGRRLLMLAEVEPAKLVFFEHWFEALSPVELAPVLIHFAPSRWKSAATA